MPLLRAWTGMGGRRIDFGGRRIDFGRKMEEDGGKGGNLSLLAARGYLAT